MSERVLTNRFFKILIPLFIIVLIVLSFNLLGLKNKLSSLTTELNNRNLEITNLNRDVADLKEDNKNLGKEYSNLKEETASLLHDVETYQNEIQASLEWYKQNSVLSDVYKQERVKSQIDNNCFEIEGDDCRIKLGCFYLINSEKLDLEYQYDESVYEKDDKLGSINDFLENGGGDCEDYSLFFKAEYNYALSQCGDKTIILEGWKYADSEDEETRYWLNFQKSWFLRGVAKVDITGNIFPNIICGNLYDPILGDISGHCMIAFTKSKIQSVDDLYQLNGAYIVEPQDGSFRGNINQINSGVYLLDEKIFYDELVTSWIFSVITDNDYFLFSEDSLNWESYSSFSSLLEQKRRLINNLLD